MKYVKGLDTLRAFAVIFVIFQHWDLPFKTTGWLRDGFAALLPTGHFGVDLFFVLSGFLITSILLDAVKKDANKLNIIKSFIIRRSLRIFPVYYLALGILYWANYPSARTDFFWCVSYTYNIYCYLVMTLPPLTHLWSLSVEEQFYLIWPWCIVYVKKKYVKYVFFIAIGIGIATMIYTMKIQRNEYGKFLMPSCMQSFGIGGLYAWLQGTKRGTKLFMQVINILVLPAMGLTFYRQFDSHYGHFYYFFRTEYAVIAIWLIHNVLVIKPSWIKEKLLENPVLMKIGQISYGVYLFHFPLSYFTSLLIQRSLTPGSSLAIFFSNYTVGWMTKLILLFALALTSYHFFEKPVMKLKRYFEY